MAQFSGWTFTYDGINSERFGLYLCSVGDNGQSSFGYQQSIESEDNDRDIPIFKRLKRTLPTIQFQLVKMNKQCKPLPITDEDMFHINRWLFSTDTYKPLMIDHKDIVYYGVFVDGASWKNSGKQGYLTLKFQMAAPYGYSVLKNSEFRVNGSKTVVLSSKHNASKYNEIDLEFVLDAGQSSLVIENQTTGQRMEFKNLDDTCRHVYVYNEGMKHAISKTNPSVNMIPKFNREFIHLSYGDNRIKITGSGRVRFISQAKVLLQ